MKLMQTKSLVILLIIIAAGTSDVMAQKKKSKGADTTGVMAPYN